MLLYGLKGKRYLAYFLIKNLDVPRYGSSIKKLALVQKTAYICIRLGAIAQLARAHAWHA